jgi:hypothetical protein
LDRDDSPRWIGTASRCRCCPRPEIISGLVPICSKAARRFPLPRNSTTNSPRGLPNTPLGPEPRLEKKPPPGFCYPSRAGCKCWRRRGRRARSEKPYVLALSTEPTGAGTLEPLQVFMTNLAVTPRTLRLGQADLVPCARTIRNGVRQVDDSLRGVAARAGGDHTLFVSVSIAAIRSSFSRPT